MFQVGNSLCAQSCVAVCVAIDAVSCTPCPRHIAWGPQFRSVGRRCGLWSFFLLDFRVLQMAASSSAAPAASQRPAVVAQGPVPAAPQGPAELGDASAKNFALSTFKIGSVEELRKPALVHAYETKLELDVKSLLAKSHVVCLNECSPRWFKFLDELLACTVELVYQPETLTLVLFHAEAFEKRPAASRDASSRFCFTDLPQWDAYRSWRK